MSAYFTNEIFKFLRELKANNNRDWFHDNKQRYQEVVKGPLIAFLGDLSGKIEAGYEISAKSIQRQNRDTRFSRDKTPYKTTVACFMHNQNVKKSDHPHGYYLQIGDDESFFGAGVHSPPPPSVLKIRTRIVEQSKEWTQVAKLCVMGDRLKRPPKGFDPDHPHIEDLKRKDFINSTKLTKKEITSADFLKIVAAHCRTARPLMDFLSRAAE